MALLCHVSLTSYFDNLCDILSIGGPPIPYHEDSTAHFVLLESWLFNVYLLDSFYAPVVIGSPSIPGAKSMQSCPSEAVLHQLSNSTFLRLAWMVFVLAGHRYDPECLNGLGAEGHGK